VKLVGLLKRKLRLILKTICTKLLFNWKLFFLFLNKFCQQFEADRRSFMITINSFGVELPKDERAKLYPRCGKLYPGGLALLAKADEYEQVRQVGESYVVWNVF
jgi:hypothetical protein